MKKITLGSILFLLMIHFSFSQSSFVSKRISINNPSQVELLKVKEAGIDLSCGAIFKDNKLLLEVGSEELSQLENQGIQYTVLIEDLIDYYKKKSEVELPLAKARLAAKKSQKFASKSLSTKSESIDNFIQYEGCTEVNWSVPTNFNLGSMAGCLTYSEVLAELDQMRALYPNLISVKTDASPDTVTHGNSYTNGGAYDAWAGQPIYYVRISDNPDTDEVNEPESLYTGMTHSREVSSMMNLIYYMWYVLENYGSDAGIKNLVDNHEMYFIPVANPDGLMWNEQIAPNGGGLQRKNLGPYNTGNNNSRGVDLNRNYDYFWGSNPIYGGSSGNQNNNTYRGPSAFSEPETQIVRNFSATRNFKTAMNHHATSNLIPHAYNGYPAAPASGREAEYHKFCHDMTRFNRYIYGEAPDILTIANGDMSDWMLGGVADVNGKTGSGKAILALAPENGAWDGSEGGFWPAAGQIETIARRAVRMNFVNAYHSGKFAQFHDLNTSDIVTASGNLEFGIEYLGQTLGDITLNVTPVSNIQSITPPATQTGWSKLEQRTVTAAYTLDAGIQANDEIEFQVTLSNDDGYVMYRANIIKYYNPTVVTVDNPDTDNLTNWTTSGGAWGTQTTTDAFGNSTKAITDSPSGAYSNNQNKTITYNTTVDLSSSVGAVVQYYAKWDLERNFDYVQIQGSINGTTWIPLCGKYTKPGSDILTNRYSSSNSTNTSTGKSTADQNNQPTGELLYDGDTMDKWVMEEVFINTSENSALFGANNVQFRFVFDSDNTNRADGYPTTFDGFIFDDFKVTNIQIPCVTSVPSGIAASPITTTDATITWDNIASATYDLRYKETSSSTWIDINNLASATYSLTGLTASTNYEVQVRSKCGASDSAYSSSVNFTTADVQLNYCNSASTNVNDEYIGKVQLNTIDNSSGAQFYTDFTSVSTTLTKDTQFTITVTPTWTGTVYNEGYSVWIDYNIDGDFDDAGEQVWTNARTQTTPVSGNFTIPSGAVEGSTRMRVSMKYNAVPTSCETFQYGEVEDYTVTIQGLVDTTAPVITLTGTSTINLNVGDVYTEQGATASDNKDGDITASIVVGGDTVNTSAAGTYVVTYNVSDAAGNAATEVTRTVNVIPDTTAPVITLVGASPINLNVGDSYTDQGATASDNKDGDITTSIIVGGDTVNTSAAGTYVVTYNVSDAAGNAATEVARTVNVIPDTTAPVITLVGASIINLNLGDVYTEQGATASDDKDGNITASIITTGTVNTSIAGAYLVNYNVSDTAGNAATQVTRTVNIIPDTTAPVITLVGLSTINLNVGDAYTEQGATATDDIDGNLTASIVTTGTVNTSVAGAYTVNYNVSDTTGNTATEVTRTVNVIPDSTAPVITLVGASTINLNVGDVYTEQGATASDNKDGDITASIVVGGDTVNTSAAGTYVVTYNVSDAAGNAATEVTRTVNVIPDTTAPVITLVGASPINLNVGDVYAEQGATASDDKDGDITASIVVGGDTVNTSAAGTYVVTYNVSDAAGNPAAEVTRTVNVAEVPNGCTGGISSFPYAEGFENTLGAWTQSTADDINWTVDANGTPSNNTGPSNATQGSYYVFVEASTPNFPSKRAILNSPCFDLSGLTEATFSFKYHMYGSSDMGTIDLEISTDEGSTWTSIWNESGNKGNSWQTANVDVSAYTGGGIQLRFNRFVGGTWQADIAIDDVSMVEGGVVVTACSGGITAFPYTEGFENTLGAWTQSTSDDINWTVDANGTPSNNTGPASAVQGSYYIFVEASGNGTGFPNKQAIINSPCYDLSGQSSATFSFSYSMYGSSNMGTIALEASNDNGISWTSIWNESGNKGNSWQTANVDLSSYVGNSVQLRFNRVTGGTWQADVAIDNINLTTSSAFAKNNSKDKLLNVDTNTVNSFKLYPNPVKGDVLNIKLSKGTNFSYRIINMLGQVVNTGKTTQEVMVNNLEAGMYYIEVNDGNETMTKKFIKRN